jgi:Fungal chitosanase of glycosyl hydrolase group 75/Secretion system C-terminal sorting domain
MKFYAGLIAIAMAVQSWGAFPNGPSTEGTLAASLLAWVRAHVTSANATNTNAFCDQAGDNNGCDAGTQTVSLYQLGGKISNSAVTYWQSNIDVDCDGTNASVCADDPAHLQSLSFSSVDATVTPFFVIPGCQGCGSCGGGWGPFDYQARGIAYGQVGAVIYRQKQPSGTVTVGVCYAPFLDEDDCVTEIGEGSYALNKFLGIDPDPNNGGSNGGSDDTNVAFIIFPNTSTTNNRVTNFSDTAAANRQVISIGEAAAAALLGTKVENPVVTNLHGTTLATYQINRRLINIASNGNHTVSIFSLNGENVISISGTGAKTYNVSNLKSGTYIIRINLESGSFADKVMIY